EQESGQARTVDLLEWLHRKHPDVRWALVLGTDLDAEKPQWKQFDRIEQLARIVTVRRGGYGGGGGALPEGTSAPGGALIPLRRAGCSSPAATSRGSSRAASSMPFATPARTADISSLRAPPRSHALHGRGGARDRAVRRARRDADLRAAPDPGGVSGGLEAD